MRPLFALPYKIVGGFSCNSKDKAWNKNKKSPAVCSINVWAVWISLEKISTSQKTISEQQVKDVFFLLRVSPKCQIVTNNEYAALTAITLDWHLTVFWICYISSTLHSSAGGLGWTDCTCKICCSITVAFFFQWAFLMENYWQWKLSQSWVFV